MLLLKYQDSFSVGFGGNLARGSHQSVKMFSFWYFDRYTDLQYDISIEPKIPVLNIYRIPVRSPNFNLGFQGQILK